jgi:hypothetical protein
MLEIGGRLVRATARSPHPNTRTSTDTRNCKSSHNKQTARA